MQHTINKFVSDSVTAGTTSFLTGVTMTPDATAVQTVYIPLITGILAPLVKEAILHLRERRKKRKECKNQNK